MELHAPLALVTLVTLVLTAVVCDLRTRRIPNRLVMVGIALGLLFQIAPPMGGGLLASSSSLALLGGLTGLAMFLPFYALRTMGAGDVKLLAMVGVWLGPQHVAWAALWTLLAGGALALAVALGTGALRQVLANLHSMVTSSPTQVPSGGLPASPRVTGRLPYAVAIGCGAAFELARALLHSGAITP